MREKRLLVLDSDTRTAGVARACLAHLGRIDSATDATTALEAVHVDPPDVVIANPATPGVAEAGGIERVMASADGAGLVLIHASDGDDAAAPSDGSATPARSHVSAPVVAEELVAAVEGKLGLDQVREDNARLRRTVATFNACRPLARCLDPGTAFAEALDLLLATTRRSRGLAHFRRPAVAGGEGLVFRGFSRSEARRLRGTLGTTEPLGHGAGARPLVVTESPLHGLLAELGIAEPGSALLVPLAGTEREAGVMYVFDDGVAFSGDELELTAIVAEHAQIALENAERYQGAKTRALIDDVTGLHNAAYFLESADHEIERAARYGLQLSVLFLDIDRFKRVNDAHGHLIGSATLRHVAACLQDCVRQIDTLVRYGGDEFTLLLTDTTPEAATTAAERIRNAVAGARFSDEQGHRVAVTASIGVACYPHDSKWRDELVDLADKAMYRAKSIGRNRVAQASVDPD